MKGSFSNLRAKTRPHQRYDTKGRMHLVHLRHKQINPWEYILICVCVCVVCAVYVLSPLSQIHLSGMVLVTPDPAKNSPHNYAYI